MTDSHALDLFMKAQRDSERRQVWRQTTRGKENKQKKGDTRRNRDRPLAKRVGCVATPARGEGQIDRLCRPAKGKKKGKKRNSLSSLRVRARMNPSVDRLYEEAKLGMWDGVLKRLKADDRLAARAAVYARPASGWTLLHQAAFWGNDEACRFLLNAGASPAAVCHAGMRPDQAARRRKHDDLAAWLRDLAEEASQTQHAHEHRHALRTATATTGFGAIVRTACNDAMVRLRRPSKSSARVPATTTATTTDTSEAVGDTPSAIAPCSRRYNEAIEMRAATP